MYLWGERDCVIEAQGWELCRVTYLPFNPDAIFHSQKCLCQYQSSHETFKTRIRA